MTPYEEIIANDIQKYVDERGETYTTEITSHLTGKEEKWTIKVDRSPWWEQDAHIYRVRYYCNDKIAECNNGLSLAGAVMNVDYFEKSMTHNGEITTYAILSFEYEGKKYTKTVNKSEMNLTDDPDTWFWYFDENGYHFEIWGSRDEQGRPCTSSETMPIALAVNVYEPTEGYNEWIEQIDDIDVLECV